MGKRYVITEDSGCGCGTLIAGAILLSLFMAILPYLIPVAVISIILWLVLGYPKMKENKRKAQEEAEIMEIERRNELERRRIEAEIVQEELRLKNEKHSKSDWSDF